MFLFNRDWHQVPDTPGGKSDSAGGKSDLKRYLSDGHNGLT